MSKPDLGLADQPLPTGGRFTNLHAAPDLVTGRRASTAAVKEGTMAGLRRILGDVVYSVFPTDLMESVDGAYKIWKDNPDSYIPTQFDTEQDKLDALHVMRAYAECAPNGGYTIRTLSDEDPTMLIWRAQVRTVRGKADKTGGE